MLSSSLLNLASLSKGLLKGKRGRKVKEGPLDSLCCGDGQTCGEKSCWSTCVGGRLLDGPKILPPGIPVFVSSLPIECGPDLLVASDG